MSNYELTVRIQPEIESSIIAANITAYPTYVAVATFQNPCRLLYFLNSTAGQLNLSIDGVNRYLTIAPGAQAFIDVKSDGGYLAQFTTIYAAYDTAPTSGALYITPFYGAQ